MDSICCPRPGDSRRTSRSQSPGAGFLHPCHDPSHEDFIDPSRWGINKADMKFFKEEVQHLWSQGKITPSTFVLPKDHPDYVDVNHGHDDPRVGPCIYQVNELYIKKVTMDRGGMSWALMRHPDGIECDCFATHAWMEGAFEFCKKVKKSWPHNCSGLYACFLSNPQNGDVARMLSGEFPYAVPFYRALHNCKFMIVIGNEKKTIYSRLWCVFEAHEAMAMADKGELRIRLPWHVSNRTIACAVVPVVFVICGTYLVGFVLLHDVVGWIFGPVMWMFVSFTVCAIMARSLEVTLNYLLHKDRVSIVFATKCRVVCEYVELALFGLSAGMAFKYILPVANWSDHMLALIPHEVLRHANRTYVGKFNVMHALSKRNSLFGIDHSLRWEEGEGSSCFLVFQSFCFFYIYKIVLVMIRDVVKINSRELDVGFKSVRDAICTSSEDKEKIMEYISGSVDLMDQNLHNLLEVGRWNKDIRRQLGLGLDAEMAGNGNNPFHIVCGTYAWLFWIETDLAGTGYNLWANLIPVGVMIVMGVCVHGYLCDKAIFATAAYMWWGVIFVLLSNHSIFFSKDAVLNKTMRISSLPLLGCCLVMLIVTIALHHRGVRARIHDCIHDSGYGFIIHRKRRHQLPEDQLAGYRVLRRCDKEIIYL